MSVYTIEILTEDGWLDDPSYLGHGCAEDDNVWRTEQEALAACDELARDCGFDRTTLRVVEIIEGYEIEDVKDADG